MSKIDYLRSSFQNAAVSFTEAGEGIIILNVENKHAYSRISLQGAQILEWMPSDQKPVIWLSSDAAFKHAASIRGGVPVCWPWFGDHDTDSSLPAHGFARTCDWKLKHVQDHKNGATELLFCLHHQDDYGRYWSSKANLEIRMIVGEELEITLMTKNLSTSEIIISEALHTYFYINDIASTSVSGLTGCEYLDKTDNFTRKKQQGDIAIDKEIDRVYVNTTDEVIIKDHSFNRSIRIRKSGSLSTVVWNPWEQKSLAMGDMGYQGFRHMLCVETANAADNKLVIPALECHEMSVNYSLVNNT